MKTLVLKHIKLLAFLLVVLALLTWQYNESYEKRYTKEGVVTLESEYTIVAFGDSLVEGLGATEGYDFVSVLEDRLDTPILNLGKRGDTTYSALYRVDDVLAYKPELVIVLLGGNDVLHGIPIEARLKNLATIVERIKETDAEILLLGVRSGLIRDDYQIAFKVFAEQENIIYLPDVLEGILFNPNRLFDPIHPNNKGHELIADRVEPIVRLLLK